MTISQPCYGIDLGNPLANGELATSSERPLPTDVSLASIWRQLVEGSRIVVDRFFTGTRCGLVLKRKHAFDSDARLRGRRLAILEAMLSGSGQNRSPSTCR